MASKYGWTKDYILDCVYPIEVILIQEQAKRREINEYFIQMQLNNPSKEFIDSLTAIKRSWDINDGRDFDRSKFEKLRSQFGKGERPKQSK